MRALFVFGFLLFLGGCNSLGGGNASALSERYRLSSKVHQNAQVPFVRHHGEGRFANYLAMNIAYAPVKALYEQLNQDVGGVLSNRGEAHITVITPPEFDLILSKHIRIEQIEDIAIRNQIQHVPFNVVCLGAAKSTIGGKLAQSYFIVVEAPELLQIRAQIRDLYVASGGHYQDFAPHQFYPHITVGFDPRDLYLSDGAIKDQSSCRAKLD